MGQPRNSLFIFALLCILTATNALLPNCTPPTCPDLIQLAEQYWRPASLDCTMAVCLAQALENDCGTLWGIDPSTVENIEGCPSREMSHQLDTPLVAAKCVAGIVRHGGWTELMGHVLKPLRWRAHEAVLRCLDGSAGGCSCIGDRSARYNRPRQGDGDDGDYGDEDDGSGTGNQVNNVITSAVTSTTLSPISSTTTTEDSNVGTYSTAETSVAALLASLNAASTDAATTAAQATTTLSADVTTTLAALTSLASTASSALNALATGDAMAFATSSASISALLSTSTASSSSALSSRVSTAVASTVAETTNAASTTTEATSTVSALLASATTVDASTTAETTTTAAATAASSSTTTVEASTTSTTSASFTTSVAALDATSRTSLSLTTAVDAATARATSFSTTSARSASVVSATASASLSAAATTTAARTTSRDAGLVTAAITTGDSSAGTTGTQAPSSACMPPPPFADAVCNTTGATPFWQLPSNYVLPGGEVPPHEVPIIVLGNLTFTEVVIVGNASLGIIVDGCVTVQAGSNVTVILPTPIDHDTRIELAATDCVRGNFEAVNIDAPKCEKVSGATSQQGGSFGVLLTVRDNKCNQSKMLMWMAAIPIMAFIVIAIITIGVCIVFKRVGIGRGIWIADDEEQLI